MATFTLTAVRTSNPTPTSGSPLVVQEDGSLTGYENISNVLGDE
jgi:hypothetical protein